MKDWVYEYQNNLIQKIGIGLEVRSIVREIELEPEFGPEKGPISFLLM